MAQKIERKTQIIDAEGKTVGRVASQISIFLQGKHKPEFAPNADLGDKVEVLNIGKLIFTGNKFDQKIYRHHSGYAGGLKEIPLKFLFSKKPDDVLRRAVKQMLPKNKLLIERMKRLKIK